MITVKAEDADEPGNYNTEIRYSILNQEPKLPSDNLFFINPVNGKIQVNGVGLDREVRTPSSRDLLEGLDVDQELDQGDVFMPEELKC